MPQAMLAGGGMAGGQVIGATDRTASAATSCPVTYQDIVITSYSIHYTKLYETAIGPSSMQTGAVGVAVVLRYAHWMP